MCPWVVRGDYACVDAVSGKVLAYFGVDEGIARCAETVIVVVPFVSSLSGLRFEGDRCLSDSYGTSSGRGRIDGCRNHLFFVAV